MCKYSRHASIVDILAIGIIRAGEFLAASREVGPHIILLE